MGNTIAARNARIRAAINQWPTPVANAINARQLHSTMKLTRPEALRRRIKVTSSSSAITNPAMLTTPSERVTIEPAISFALGKPNDRNTLNAAGATTAPKKSAAPNQQASKISRVKFRIVQPLLIKLINRREQANLWRNNFWLRQLSRIGDAQQPGKRRIKLRLIVVKI